MNFFLVTYHGPQGNDELELMAAIQSPHRSVPVGSKTYLVKANLTAHQVSEKMKAYLESKGVQLKADSRIFIAQVYIDQHISTIEWHGPMGDALRNLLLPEIELGPPIFKEQ
jgi:hypothetical protein